MLISHGVTFIREMIVVTSIDCSYTTNVWVGKSALFLQSSPFTSVFNLSAVIVIRGDLFFCPAPVFWDDSVALWAMQEKNVNITLD